MLQSMNEITFRWRWISIQEYTFLIYFSISYFYFRRNNAVVMLSKWDKSIARINMSGHQTITRRFKQHHTKKTIYFLCILHIQNKKRSKTQPWFHFVLLDKLSEKTESINLLKTMETKPRSFIALRFHCIIEPAKIFVIVFAVLCWKLNTKDQQITISETLFLVIR